jgi:hypothetical protein
MQRLLAKIAKRQGLSKPKREIRRRLKHEWQAGCHEDDTLADHGELLVETTLSVAEDAAQSRVRHDAGANLIGDENHGSNKLLDRACQCVALRLDVAAGEQTIAEPKRQAIDDDDSVGLCHAPQDRHERMGFFDDAPGAFTRGPMFFEACRHFGIMRLCRGNENGALAGIFGKFLRKAAFARPSAADDEETCGICLLFWVLVQYQIFPERRNLCA